MFPRKKNKGLLLNISNMRHQFRPGGLFGPPAADVIEPDLKED